MEWDGQDAGPADAAAKGANLATIERQYDFARLLEKNGFSTTAIKMYLEVARHYVTWAKTSNDTAVSKKLADVRLRTIGLAKQLKHDELPGLMVSELERLLDDQSLALKQASDDVSRAAAYLDAGLAYERLGRDKKAISTLGHGLDVDRAHWPQDPQLLSSVLFTLYDLSVAMEKQNDLEAADAAMENCRELVDVVLTQSKDARNRAWAFTRSALLKEKRGDANAACEYAIVAINVPFPLDDEGLLRKDGIAMFNAVTQATRILLRAKQQDDGSVQNGYERRVELARRLAEVVNDPASWFRLVEVLDFKAVWHGDRHELDLQAEVNRQERDAAKGLVNAAKGLVERDRSAKNLGWLAIGYKYLGATLATLKRYDEAQAEYDALLKLQHQIDELAKDEKSLTALLDAFARLSKLAVQKGDFDTAEGYIRAEIDAFESRRGRLAGEVALKKRSGLDLDLSWSQLVAKKPQDAVTTVREGLARNPDYIELATNLLHGLLLQGKFEGARSVLKEHRYTILADRKKSFAEVILDDFKALREHGIDHPDMAKIEELIHSWSESPSNETPPM